MAHSWATDCHAINLFHPVLRICYKVVNVIECDKLGDVDYFLRSKFLTNLHRLCLAGLSPLFVEQKLVLLVTIIRGTQRKWAGDICFASLNGHFRSKCMGIFVVNAELSNLGHLPEFSYWSLYIFDETFDED